MKERKHYTKLGYTFTVQKSGTISHLIITDSTLYPDEDSRSEEYWRHNGLLLPINDDKDLKEIGKLFNL